MFGPVSTAARMGISRAELDPVSFYSWSDLILRRMFGSHAAAECARHERRSPGRRSKTPSAQPQRVIPSGDNMTCTIRLASWRFFCQLFAFVLGLALLAGTVRAGEHRHR